MDYRIESNIKATGNGAVITVEVKQPVNLADDCSLSNVRCKDCGTPLDRYTIRKMVRCPVCGALNERM